MRRTLGLFPIDLLIILLMLVAMLTAILPQIYWKMQARGGDLTGVWVYQGTPSGTIIFNERLLIGYDGCGRVCIPYRHDGDRVTIDRVWYGSNITTCYSPQPMTIEFSPNDLQRNSYLYSVEGDTLYLYRGFQEALEFKRNPDGKMVYSDSC